MVANVSDAKGLQDVHKSEMHQHAHQRQQTWTSHTMTRPSSDAVAAYAASWQNPTDSTDAVCALNVPRTCTGSERLSQRAA